MVDANGVCNWIQYTLPHYYIPADSIRSVCKFESYPDYDYPSAKRLVRNEDRDDRYRFYIGVDALRIVCRHSLCVLGIIQKHTFLVKWT
jgi:hypothetical protein